MFFEQLLQFFGLADIHITVGFLPAAESRTINGVFATDFVDQQLTLRFFSFGLRHLQPNWKCGLLECVPRQ